MSTIDGLQVPVIPFVDVVANVGTTSPAQIVKLAPKENAGKSFGVTVNVNDADMAHCPAFGVKV